MDTLAFGYILPTTGRIRDFNPLETCAARRTTQKTLKVLNFQSFEEAQTGFEPVDTGVADHCLTTWLLRHI